MTEPAPPNPKDFETRALLALALVATVLFALILQPFFGAVCWAVFLAIVFRPMYERLRRDLRGRPALAALASLVVILLIVVLPLSFVATSVMQEAAAFAGKLRTGEIKLGEYFHQALAALPAWLHGAFDRLGITDLGDLQDRVVALLGDSKQALTTRAFSLGHLGLEVAVGFFVMAYVLFFLFRDGDRLASQLAHAIPLRPDHTERLFAQFAAVVRATVKGNVVVAAVQGTLGGLAFWALGLTAPMLWGAVMGLFGLLPAVGAFLIWGPVAAYYLITGSVLKAVGLTLWGSVVIGLIDNFLRPRLVGRDTRMPDFLVLVSTLGGLVVFGLNGFVIGPVIAAMFLVSWELLAAVRNEHREPPRQ